MTSTGGQTRDLIGVASRMRGVSSAASREERNADGGAGTRLSTLPPGGLHLASIVTYIAPKKERGGIEKEAQQESRRLTIYP